MQVDAEFAVESPGISWDLSSSCRLCVGIIEVQRQMKIDGNASRSCAMLHEHNINNNRESRQDKDIIAVLKSARLWVCHFTGRGLVGSIEIRDFPCQIAIA